MIIDLTKDVQASNNTDLLAGLLSMLVGQPCVKAEFSYGGEFKFHFGGPVPYKHPKLADKKKGAWVLGVRASKWRLLLLNPPLLIEIDWPEELKTATRSSQWKARPPVDEAEVEKATSRLVGQMVMDVQPMPFTLGVGLQIVFADGSNLVICPNPEEDEDPEPLADWELLTPYRARLQVGPGVSWRYLRFQDATGGQAQAS